VTQEYEELTITHSKRGKKLRNPITVSIPINLRPGEKAVYQYVIDAFTVKMPSLIPLTFENEALLNLASYLKRHTIGSVATLYQYTYGIYRFSEWISQTPDQIFYNCKTSEGYTDPEAIERLTRNIDDFIGDLQAEGLAPGTINNHVKGVKALFRVNGIALNLPFRLTKRIKYRDRAPNPEELQKIIDLGDIREKAIVSILALSGLRVGTLVKLQYRHVQKDLENGVTPIHLFIESDITKGKYHSYDTFLGSEAATYLRAYLESRKAGTRRLPPEELNPNSPLIRSKHSKEVKPLSESQIHRIIHQLYRKAGLIEKTRAKRYRLRAHSLRKYFRTQLGSLGTIPPDYIEYMMGHTISTYQDIQMKGIEFLRNLYASSGLGIRPKTQASKIDMLRAVATSLGLDPDKVLSKDAITNPNRTIMTPESSENTQSSALTNAIKKAILKELDLK